MSQPNNRATDASLPYQRLIIKGRIVVPRALHIGSGQASLLTDAAIRRDRNGQPYIPGSSLAGLLRSTAEDFAPYLCSNADETIRRLFGGKRDDEDFRASRLLVEDAYLRELLPADIEIRDYVGIDRCRAAARAHLKYDREVAPSNTSYEFEMSIEEPGEDDVRLLLAVLDFWSEYGLQIGARTTTGLGEARVGSLQFFALDFKKSEVLRSYLLDGDTDARHIPTSVKPSRPNIAPFFNDSITPEHELFCPEHLFVTIALVLEEPLLIKGNIPEVPDLSDGQEAQSPSKRTSDAEFITALQRDGSNKVYIPGSSLKGILRTRAEKIIRTLNFYRGYANIAAAEADSDAETKYEERITACAITHAEDSRMRLKACFGDPERQETVKKYAAKKKKAAIANKQKESPIAPEIYHHSCPTCRVFGNSMMRGRLTCSEATPVVTLSPKLFDHVAIDRFTGGAADAKKFDTRPLMPITNPADLSYEKAFTFTLHLERPELWMFGMLGHLLKDLNSADIRIGHATRRGYGRVRGYVTKATLLVLPNTDLMTICRAVELDTEKRFAVYGPYSEIGLNDWVNIFSPTPWSATGADAVLRETPGAKLFAKADEAFQACIVEAEGQVEQANFGEFHDTTNDSD
jgi:CRISPR/Cas system CSM-associated protein Csm3 (group 7 of RAMP superfamily)